MQKDVVTQQKLKGDFEMKRGDQIAYIPSTSAPKAILYNRIEYGFVHNVSSAEVIFCRYWIQGKLGTLRTTVNSEATNKRDLFLYKSVDPVWIEKTMKDIERKEEK